LTGLVKMCICTAANGRSHSFCPFSLPVALDATKNPCVKVRCPPHRVCVSHDYQTAICTNTNDNMSTRWDLYKYCSLYQIFILACRPCPVIHPSPVCGSDGHTYSSKVRHTPPPHLALSLVLSFFYLSSQPCFLITLMCVCVSVCMCLCVCVCLVCSDGDLHSLASRLKDWFGVLHLDANRDLKSSANSDSAAGRDILPICKDSLGWMFNKLDMNYDLLLDQSELSAIYLDKYELCMKPLFNSCDSFKDGKLSNNEWCYCFQKPDGERDGGVKREMEGSQIQGRRNTVIGVYIPRCSEEGYFKPTQCHGSTGQCWCVDKYGNEIAGSRKQGNPTCGKTNHSSHLAESFFKETTERGMPLNVCSVRRFFTEQKCICVCVRACVSPRENEKKLSSPLRGREVVIVTFLFCSCGM
uniref:SPARC (osteonectin), cwcv and kazal like domains proteoglycan 1 n=1 Tax=Salmo trutta TaxID=8032 RepID=A0A674DQ06_SALTR